MPTHYRQGKGRDTIGKQGLQDRFGNGAAIGRLARQFPVGEIAPLELSEAVIAVVSAGDAIMVACTRDGGALVITILSGDDRKKFYPDDLRSCHAALEQIAAAYGQPAQVRPGDLPDDKIG